MVPHDRRCSGYHMATRQLGKRQFHAENVISEKLSACSLDGGQQQQTTGVEAAKGAVSEAAGVEEELLTPCTKCGARPSLLWAQRELRSEDDMQNATVKAKSVMSGAPVWADWPRLVKRLKPPHPHHGL